MKLRWLTTLILANAVFTASVNASSGNTAGIDRSALREVLQTTGITPQVQLLEELVLQSATTNSHRCGTKPPSPTIPSFSAESIIFDTLNGFQRADTLNVSELQRWFSSPLADKIHQAEQTSIDREQFINSLPAIKQDERRLQSIKNIISNTKTIEFIVTLGTEIEYAGILHSGCIAKAELLSSGSKNPERLLAEATRSDKELTGVLIGTEITFELAYLLRGLSDDELKRYESFTASDNAQQFYPRLIESVEKSFGLASDRITLQESYSAIDF